MHSSTDYQNFEVVLCHYIHITLSTKILVNMVDVDLAGESFKFLAVKRESSIDVNFKINNYDDQ